MDKFKYSILVCGGPHDNPWDKEMVVKADDIYKALKSVKQKVEKVNGWIVSIEQVN
jgi:hypothetical protein